MKPGQVLRILEWGPAQGDYAAIRSEYDDLILPRRVFNISGAFIVTGHETKFDRTIHDLTDTKKSLDSC